MAYSRFKALKMKLSNDSWLTLPYSLYQVSYANESRTYTMMSGKTTETVLGYRKQIRGRLDYVPQETVQAFNQQVLEGGYQLIEYIDTDGETKQDYFKVEPFSPTVMIFRDNQPMWHDMSLAMTSQEVFNV